MPAARLKGYGENMTLNTIIDIAVRGTICCICLGFGLLGLIAIWKWFFGVMKNALLYLFPGFKGRRTKDKEEKQ